MGAKYLLALLPVLLLGVQGKSVRSTQLQLNSRDTNLDPLSPLGFVCGWLSLWDAEFFMLHRDDIPGQAGRRPILSVLYRSVSASITGPFRNSRSPAFYQALSDKKALKIHFLFFQSTRPVALKLPFVFHRQPPKNKTASASACATKF